MAKDRVIPFKVEYYDITGNHLSALVLVQLEYWQPKAFNGWISKTEDELKDELRVSYRMLQRVQADLVNLGFIQVKQMHFKGKKTTHYRVDTVAVKDAIEALNTDSELTKGQVNQRVNQPKVKLTKGKDRKLLKVNLGIDERSTLYTESTTESTTDTTSTEINSVPQLFKSDLMQDALVKAIDKNQEAKPKAKKEKKELSPLDKEIAEKVKSIVDGFTKWHLENKGEPYLSTKLDFINLTKLFKKLNNTAGYTPEQTIEKLRVIFKNYDKLSVFSKNNFTVNYLATKHNILLSEIESYKAPVQKRNFNEPVPFVPAIKEKIDYYNTMPLPVGLSDEVFRELGEAVYREKVMDEEVDPKQISGSQFTEMLYRQIRNLPYQEIHKILENYGIV